MGAPLRKRFSLADEDYQIASTVIAEAKKAGRIIPADPSQGRKKRPVCALLGNDKSVNSTQDARQAVPAARVRESSLGTFRP
jgi:hypothetical protein